MGDPELLEHLPLDQARWVVSTIRDRDLNLNLLRAIKERKFRGRVALTARWEEEAEAFIRAGDRPRPAALRRCGGTGRRNPGQGRPRPKSPDETSLKFRHAVCGTRSRLFRREGVYPPPPRSAPGIPRFHRVEGYLMRPCRGWEGENGVLVKLISLQFEPGNFQDSQDFNPGCRRRRLILAGP